MSQEDHTENDKSPSEADSEVEIQQGETEKKTEDDLSTVSESEQSENELPEVSPDVNEDEKSQTDEHGKKFIPYDFAHPSHKLNSRLPVLEVINEKTANAMTDLLTAQFHQSVDVRSLEPTFEKFQEYANSIAACVSIGELSIEPLSGNAILVLDGDLIYKLVDSFFGGVDNESQPSEDRGFTPTEQRIIERVREIIFESMRDAWQPVLVINPAHKTQISRSELASPAHPSAVIICNRFEIGLKGGRGECHILIPYSVLEPVRPQLTNDLKKMCDQDYEWIKEFTQQVLSCDIDLQGVFAESNITVKQLINLKVGDFIPLGNIQTVDFSSEGIPLFEAAVGVSNGMVSASVTKWHEHK